MTGAGGRLCVFNLTRESFLCLELRVADTHFTRLRGLLGRPRLTSDEGLWIVPCQGIHTIGLLYPIDVVYLDHSLRVVHVIERLLPFRIAPVRRRSASLLELPERTIFWSNTKVGDQLVICSHSDLASLWKPQTAREVPR